MGRRLTILCRLTRIFVLQGFDEDLDDDREDWPDKPHWVHYADGFIICNGPDEGACVCIDIRGLFAMIPLEDESIRLSPLPKIFHIHGVPCMDMYATAAAMLLDDEIVLKDDPTATSLFQT